MGEEQGNRHDTWDSLEAVCGYVHAAGPPRLGAVLGLRAGPGEPADGHDRGETGAEWDEQDLADMLRHQLAAPVPAAVVSGAGRGASEVPRQTFAHVLNDPAASREVLERIRRLGETRPRGAAAGALPGEVSAVLALAARAALWLRYGAEADVEALREALTEALRRPWVGPPLSDLLRQALEREGAPEREPSSGAGPAGATLADAGPLPRLEGYEVLGPLGQGGMGTVWRAVQCGTGRAVALKLMNPAAFGSPTARARFEREVELTARLDHPGIARLYESGVAPGGGWGAGGACYYAMELIEGAPLHEYAARRRLGDEDVVRLAAAVCEAVTHAHQRGVIHRDLKPANILVTEDGRPHVLDFGLARALEEGSGGAAGGAGAGMTLTLAGEVAGTLGFMAPEQLGGRPAPADTRSDVYALGSILYLLLTRRPPHDLEGPRWQVMRRVAEQEPARPRAVRPGLDADLEAVLLKALAREPERRYASAAELGRDLRAWLAGEPLSARAPTLAYLAANRLRRHRLPIAAALALAASLAAMCAYGYARIGRERDLADAQRKVAQAQRLEAEALRQAAEASAARAAGAERSAVAAKAESDARLADGLVAQGDAMAEAGRWFDARERYGQARDALAAQGRATLPADSGLVNAWRFAPPPLCVLDARAGLMVSAAFSPDGRCLAAGGADGAVRVWDLETCRVIATLPTGGGKVNCVAFSPDGAALACGCDDATVRRWDWRSRRQVWVARHREGALSVAFSPDGGRLASTASDATARVWDAADGRAISTFTGHASSGRWIHAVAFSPDGRRCLSGSNACTWDPATGELVCRWTAGASAVPSAFSPDGRLAVMQGVVEGRHGASLELWDVESGRPVREMAGHRGLIDRVAFPSPDRCLSLGHDAVVRAWDVATGAQRSAVCLDPTLFAGGVLSADGRLVAALHATGPVRVYDLSRAAPPSLLVTVRHPGPVERVRPTPDGRVFLTAGEPGRGEQGLRAWDAATGQLLWAPAAQQPPPLMALDVSPDGRDVLTGGGFDKRVLCWGLFDKGPRRFMKGEHPDVVRAVAFSPDGRRALSHDGTEVTLWDVQSGEKVRSWKTGATLNFGVAFSADGARALGVTVHGSALQWDLNGGGWLPSPGWYNRVGEVSSFPAAFSPEGARAFAGTGLSMALWDAFTGKALWRAQSPSGTIRAVARHPSGKWAATGDAEGNARVWDLAAGREVRCFAGHQGPLSDVAFSADGQTLFTCGEDGAATAWDMAWPQRCRSLEARAAEARRSLAAGRGDADALLALGEWYALLGRWDWATDLLDRARAGGADVSPLLQARCHWGRGDWAAAAAEFARAVERHEAPADYLRLCREAAGGGR